MTPKAAFLSALPIQRVRQGWRPLRMGRTPRAQLAGSIEDMPAEKIPHEAGELPSHWGRPGVYGVYSSSDKLQYVAAVDDVRTAISNHIRYVNPAEDRYSVRMLTVDRVSDAPLGQIAESWVLTHAASAGAPPGNCDIAPEWRLQSVFGDLVLDTGEGDEFLEQEIRRVIRENGVVLFMKGVQKAPRCGFSAFVVDAVRDVVGEEFVCVDCLDGRNGGIREEIKKFSGWPTLPQLYVNGEFVGGADIVRDLIGGELETLLKKAHNTVNV